MPVRTTKKPIPVKPDTSGFNMEGFIPVPIDIIMEFNARRRFIVNHEKRVKSGIYFRLNIMSGRRGIHVQTIKINGIAKRENRDEVLSSHTIYDCEHVGSGIKDKYYHRDFCYYGTAFAYNSKTKALIEKLKKLNPIHAGMLMSGDFSESSFQYYKWKSEDNDDPYDFNYF